MNNPEQEIENMLRRAPAPKPPGELKDRLIRGVQLGAPQNGAQRSVTAPLAGGWLRRWWPALGPAAVSLACAVVLTVQQVEIRDLKQSINALSPAPGTESVLSALSERSATTTAPTGPASVEEEIARLKELANRLAAEVAELERLRADNTKLRAQLAAPVPGALTPEEAAALTAAGERTMRIQCVNNLKQFGLAVRVWALDNGDTTPPDIISMSNELSTPKILVCPADKARKPAASWSAYTAANCSYEYLAPSAPDGIEPTRVLSRCPIHGTVGLCDGSVQMVDVTKHPERFVERDGKLYYEPKE